MLNQQKSKRINTLKFGVIIPFLALFMFLINTKTVAQTKSLNETVIAEMKFEVVIDKNATNDELNAHSKFIKEKDGIDLKFLGIKRNSNNEIIQIKSTFKAKDAGSGTLTRNGDEPIKPFTFYYEIDENKNLGSFGYGATEEIKKLEIDYTDLINEIEKNGTLSEATKEKLKRNLKKEFEVKAINAQETTVTSSINTINHTDEFGNNVVWNKSDLINPTNPIFYVDGIEKGSEFDINSIDPNHIEEIVMIESKRAVEKYGENGKNGIISVATRPKIKEQSDWKVEEGVAIKFIDDNDNSFVNLEEFLDEEIKEPVFIVDGENMGKNYKNIKIKYSQLEGIGTFLPNKFTSAKYGAIGKDGVISITTKKAIQESSKWNLSAGLSSELKDTDEDGYLLLKTLLRPDMTKPIIIVDGKNKGTSINKIKIKTSKIESYGVWPPSQDAIERFGKKAKNGVIEIKTKKENQN